LRARSLHYTNIRPIVVIATILAVWTCSAAQQETRRLVALIGITTEIAPIEEKIGTPMVTRIQGVVFTSGSIDGTRVVAVRSGVGKVNAAMAATFLADHFSPSVVIFTGTAGAVDTELNPADVVIGSAVGYHDFGDVTADGMVRSATLDAASGRLDPRFFPAAPQLLDAARRAAKIVKLSAGPGAANNIAPRISEGVIVTGDAFMANPARRLELRRELKASAVEMEGAAVAQVCSRFGIPVIVIRSITDRADGSASQSYSRYLQTASRNAADLALATIHELVQ
jgi:adenosylhomocysteine nucleosidase